jgi:hypothetical protein
MLSIGLGGHAEPRDYSYHLGSTDLTRTISGELAAAPGRPPSPTSARRPSRPSGTQVDARYHLVDITSPVEGWPRELPRRASTWW